MPKWCASELRVTYGGKSKCPNVQNRALRQFRKDHVHPTNPAMPLNLWMYNDYLKECAEARGLLQEPFIYTGGFWGGVDWNQADFGYRSHDDMFGARETDVTLGPFTLPGDLRRGKPCLLYEFATPQRAVHWSILGILKHTYPELDFELIAAKRCEYLLYRAWVGQKNGAQVTVTEEFPPISPDAMVPFDCHGNEIVDKTDEDWRDDVCYWQLPAHLDQYQDVWSRSD